MVSNNSKRIMARLQRAIYDAKARGIEVNRVFMGIEIAQMIISSYQLILNYNDTSRIITIFGLPVEIDDKDKMRLEVAMIEKVFVGDMRE